MTKRKFGALCDDKPVKLAIELPAAIHSDLTTYAEVLARETAQPIVDRAKLIAPMVRRLMAKPPVRIVSGAPSLFWYRTSVSLRPPRSWHGRPLREREVPHCQAQVVPQPARVGSSSLRRADLSGPILQEDRGGPTKYSNRRTEPTHQQLPGRRSAVATLGAKWKRHAFPAGHFRCAVVRSLSDRSE